MTPIYVKTGVLFRDSIVVQLGDGSFVTGDVNGDYTKQFSNGTTGNITPTGITVTEVDASNNPGVYDILIPAALLSTNGNYTLKLYKTADPTFSWSQEYIATASGSPASTGTVSFTATANDGRIEDGAGSPLEDATVYLTNGTWAVEATSDASGLWGPIYFDASFGTVTITVIKSGYTVASSSLSVGASSVTGPGVDIALTATAASGTVTASTLWAFARRLAHNKTGAQADLKIKQLCNDAIDRLAMDVGSNGNWYIRKGYLATKTAYVTGTIALTQDDTTCVLTGGTFPSWAGNGRLLISGQPIIEIAARNSDTSLTLAGDWGGATNSYSYTLFLDNYALESNAFEFMGIMNGQQWPWAVNGVSIERLWEMQNNLTSMTQRNAWAYAIANNRMHLFPYPSEEATAAYIYRARPLPLDAETDVADVDPTWISTLHHAIGYYVAVYFGESVGGTKEESLAYYNDSLARLIGNIKTPRGIGNRPTNMNRNDYWRAQTRTI